MEKRSTNLPSLTVSTYQHSAALQSINFVNKPSTPATSFQTFCCLFISSSRKHDQARRQDSVTGGGGGAEINFRVAREVYLCELERGTGAREIYPSLDQMSKMKTKDSKGFSGRNREFQRFFRPITGDLKKKGLY